MQEKIYIKEAIDLLKKKFILIASTQNQKTYFFYKKNLFYVRTNSYSTKINENDFIHLYKDTVFFIEENNSCEIDSEKDNVYYSYKPTKY